MACIIVADLESASCLCARRSVSSCTPSGKAASMAAIGATIWTKFGPMCGRSWQSHLLKEKQAAGLKRDILDLREACWAVQREPLHLLTVFRLAHIDVGFGQMFFECGYSKREICALFWSSIVVSFCFSGFLKFFLGSCFPDAKHGVTNVFHKGSS